ncbi:MAG: FtsX-like permease family protein [Ktedonobacteraceae bacterium]
MRAITSKVFKDIFHRKLRTTLTIVGIAIGILGLSAINIASSQIRSSFEYSTDVSAQPDIQFFTPPTSASLLSVLRNQPNVKTVQAESSITTRWIIPSGHFSLTMLGVEDFQNVQINKFELVKGSLPSIGQIVLESSDAAVMPVKVGDQVEVNVRGVPQKLTVSGFVRTRGRPSSALLQRALAYMHESDLESLFQMRGVNNFLFQLHNYGQHDATARQLAQVFAQQHILVLGVSVGHSDYVSSIADGLFSTMRVLSIIALLLSVFLLLGTITALVTEQLQVIGTMKAIGASRGQVMRHYLSIVLVYGIAGTLIGLIAGVLGGYLLVSYFGNLLTLDIGTLAIPPTLILESLAIGIGVPLLAAVLPVYFGTRITVHAALSGYGLDGSQQRGGKWGRVFGLNFIPQTIQLGMRSLFRKRARAILTLLTLVIAGSAFLAVQTTAYSFGTFLDQVFTAYHFDILVSVPNPEPISKLQHALLNVQGVQRVEPLIWNDVDTSWGTGLLTGVEPDTQLYQKQLVSGRWFDATDQNAVIISQDAAAKSGLQVGDSISFHGATASATWNIIGIVKDYNGIGPGALGVLLAPIAEINAFKQLPSDFVQTVMLSSSDNSVAGVNALASRIDTSLSATGLQASITTAQQQIQRDQGEFQILYALLDTVAVIVALVGAIGLFNTLAMSVLERRREIGILRSMGASGSKVAQVFWTEGISQGVISWLIALVLGIPASYGFVLLLGNILVPVPFAFSSTNLLWMLIFILLVATIASVGPAWGAARVKIAQTLRYE